MEHVLLTVILGEQSTFISLKQLVMDTQLLHTQILQGFEVGASTTLDS